MNRIENNFLPPDMRDYVPIVSTITNIVNLFFKCVIMPCLSQEIIQESHFYTHLQEKSFARCILLLVPILGNAVIVILDILDYVSSRSPNEELVLQMGQSGFALQNATEEEKRDFDTVNAAVSIQGSALQYADDSLKNNRAIVLTALCNDQTAFQYAGDDLKNSHKFIVFILEKARNPLVFQYAGEEIRRNFNIAKTAVQMCGSMLQYADDALKDNQEIVLAASQNDPTALQYANPRFQI